MGIKEGHDLVMSAIKPILYSVFQEENVSIEDSVQDVEGSFNASIIIKFPELTIKNDEYRSHTIYDLYVNIAMQNDHLTDTFRGTRGKLSQLEASSSYSHSHLKGGAINRFGPFCRGSSNFQHTQSILTVDSWLDSNNNIIEDKLFQFEGWLFEMIGFLEWESLSGRPHKYMSEIGKGTDNTAVPMTDLRISYLRFLKNADFTRLKLVFDAGRYKLDDTREFEEELLKTATVFQYCSEDGKYYGTPTLHPTGIRTQFMSFKFKGIKVIQEVFASDVARQAQPFRTIYAHRSIKQHIYEQLQRDIRSAQDRYTREIEAKNIAYRIAGVRNTYSQREMLPENLIPVSSD
jgi:hypothetical protein